MDDNYKLVIRKTYTNGDLYMNDPDEFLVQGKFIDNRELDLSDYLSDKPYTKWSRDIKDALVFDHEFEQVFRGGFQRDGRGQFLIELFKSWHKDVPVQIEQETKTQSHQYIEYDLNPNKDTDLSKVNLRLDPEKGARIKWYDCGESVSNFIKADQTGLAKLERMILALEISKKHILKLIADEKKS